MNIVTKINSELAIRKIEKKDSFLSSKKVVVNIELLHLPYYFFKSEINLSKEKSIVQHICVDGLMGEFAFVERDKIEFISDRINDNTELLISELEAFSIAKNAVKSMLMVQKGKGIDLVSIGLELVGMLKYPYWVGYYQRKSGIDFEVIDAVNGKKQGAKMKPVFIKLIMQ
jgi:hypothetical protein